MSVGNQSHVDESAERIAGSTIGDTGPRREHDRERTGRIDRAVGGQPAWFCHTEGAS
jgi:hypothetical protein